MERKHWCLLIKCCRNFCYKPVQLEKVTKETAVANLLAEKKANWTKKKDEAQRRKHDHSKLEGKKLTITANEHDELEQLPDSCLERSNEPHYYHQNGLLKVYPYYHIFRTYVKQDWIGRNILDVCSTVFLNAHTCYARKLIEEGKIMINGEPVKPDFILKYSHLIQTSCHRHEKPVKQADLEILAEDNDVLVVNKPCSWPIHSSGQYHKNSFINILKKQYGYHFLQPVYRLDRLTSGVLICAKNLKTASKLSAEIRERSVQKEYVARVVGHFPSGIIECSQPVPCVSTQLKKYRVDPKIKESWTTFERLSYNGKTSVVKCMPRTGRTHQIRLHLQHLGHPIVNDCLYGPEANDEDCHVLLSETGQEIFQKFGAADLQDNLLYKKKLAAVNQRKLGSHRETIRTDCDNKVGQSRDRTIYRLEDKSSLDIDVIGKPLKSSGLKKVAVIKDYDEEKMFDAIDVDCEECKKDRADPTDEDLIMYLHAYRYKGSDWGYSAPLPDWAQQDWPE